MCNALCTYVRIASWLPTIGVRQLNLLAVVPACTRLCFLQVFDCDPAIFRRSHRCHQNCCALACKGRELFRDLARL